MAKNNLNGIVSFLNFQEELNEKVLEQSKLRKYTSFEDAIRIFDEGEGEIHYVYTGLSSWFCAKYNVAKQKFGDN